MLIWPRRVDFRAGKVQEGGVILISLLSWTVIPLLCSQTLLQRKNLSGYTVWAARPGVWWTYELNFDAFWLEATLVPLFAHHSKQLYCEAHRAPLQSKKNIFTLYSYILFNLTWLFLSSWLDFSWTPPPPKNVFSSCRKLKPSAFAGGSRQIIMWGCFTGVKIKNKDLKMDIMCRV